MTYTEFEKRILSEFKGTLIAGNFVDGDIRSASEVAQSSMTPFYRYFGSNPDTQGKPFIVYDIVPINDGVYADDSPQAYWVTIGVDIVMSNVFGTLNEQVLRNELENTMAKKPSWRCFFSGEYVDTDNKRKVISYDFRRLFRYGDN